MKRVIVLGIDCGIAITGWAIISSIKQHRRKPQMKVLDYGVIQTKSNEKLAKRLVSLYEALCSIIHSVKLDSVAIESLFYFKNQKTIMSVGQARGVALLACAQKPLPIYDYTPLQVKQSVTGYGKASKQQVQIMVKNLLKLKELPRPDDAADALAIAVCHLHTHSW